MKRPNVSHVWKYEDSNNFIYPENDEAYNDFFQGKENFGMCFSGGGTRAATCAVGQLRGLHMIGVLDKAKYIASNSGGTWGSLPYIYFKGDLDNYFGEYYPPEKLTFKNVTEIGKKYFLHQMTEANIFLETLINKLSGDYSDESFSQVVAECFLKPLNVGYIKKYFTLNEVSFDRIKNNNPNVKSSDFEYVEKGRPFHIANGTLHNWKVTKEGFIKSRKGGNRLYHVEMTPLYAGVKVFHKEKGDHNTDIGGGYVDPFAFDSIFKNKIQKGDLELVKVEYIKGDGVPYEKEFTLADVMGISGSAPTSVDISVEKLGLEEPSLIEKLDHLSNKVKNTLIQIPSNIYKGLTYFSSSLPESHHFSPLSTNTENNKNIEYNVGDGGPVDDIGLMPLLARDVPKILCFCNVQFKILEENKTNGFNFIEKNFDNDILCFFGLKRKRFSKKIKPIKDGGFQKVFHEDDFNELSTGLEEAMKKNEPLIYIGTHEVLENEHFGIKGGYTVQVMWFYNERCKTWEDEIDKSIFEGLEDDIGEKGFGKRLKNFPNFKTFGENAFRVVDMHVPQVTLLSNYQTWIIERNKDKIRDFLSLNDL